MERATNQVRLTYILEAIAKEEKVEISDEEMKERLAPVAAMRGEGATAESMFETFKTNGNLEAVRAHMIGEKVVEFIIENAK
jgi:trigger factor